VSQSWWKNKVILAYHIPKKLINIQLFSQIEYEIHLSIWKILYCIFWIPLNSLFYFFAHSFFLSCDKLNHSLNFVKVDQRESLVEVMSQKKPEELLWENQSSVCLASQLGKFRVPHLIAMRILQQFIHLRDQFLMKVTWHIFKDKVQEQNEKRIFLFT
jgi:hypothetical protein